MFSVYGKAGRVFRGSMEELRKVGPASALARTAKTEPVTPGMAGEATTEFAVHTRSPGHDMSAKGAASAYAESGRNTPQRHPLTKVSDIMTREVVTIPDAYTVGQAWNVLSTRHLGQAPVVSAQGVLVGLLSRADLLRPDRLPGPDTHALVWKALLAQNVTEWMWTPVPSVAADTDIRRVARVLLDAGLPGLPVVDDQGLVVAFVSRSDILRAVVADPPLDLWS